ncbi:MAG: acetyl-CoA carboxylase biotin carboxylase subunit [Verrucomicrobiales bacterium]|nr:acetyl-CoA carboxylase biotin carboxylase subunit [Verrucomicrobiales bacterium]MCP5525783.1 acetyl-CoA carboxylase biotin carboxylase subunit [Verrucomicrobiales bacterium]
MFEKILIANRGEIAIRVIRTCREMGIKTVAVYSEADANSMHVQLADEAICIGPPPASESYLRVDRLISAAEVTDVDAIHPGYGFLSENAQFADICESCNIRFIGPSSAAMNALKDKAASRELAKKAGVPVPPGSVGAVANEQEALAVAKQVGYPVLIKAVSGGGGRGMRVAHNDISLMKGFHMARSEAEKAFGNAGVYIEKYFENPHHVEFQIVGDGRGNVIHFGERDCSVQRRHQKLIEETPSPLLQNRFKDLRKKMGKAAIRIAEAARYTNAGTVEFIVDDDGKFYFLEVNKRIQVEHPVSEEVTATDLIRMQILVAAGELPKLSQSAVRFHGHSIECRINAEDPYDGFRPSPGRVEMYYPPGGRGVRVESHIYSGYVIPAAYDSMIGKLIVTGQDREDALNRMSRALSEFIITGVKTTIPFLQTILLDPDFRRGDYSTGFIDRLQRRGNP